MNEIDNYKYIFFKSLYTILGLSDIEKEISNQKIFPLEIVENDEWIEMVEFSLPHLEKALTKEIKNIVTEEEIIILKQNKYVKKVTSKGITYTDEFKRILFI